MILTTPHTHKATAKIGVEIVLLLSILRFMKLAMKMTHTIKRTVKCNSSKFNLILSILNRLMREGIRDNNTSMIIHTQMTLLGKMTLNTSNRKNLKIASKRKRRK